MAHARIDLRRRRPTRRPPRVSSPSSPRPTSTSSPSLRRSPCSTRRCCGPGSPPTGALRRRADRRGRWPRRRRRASTPPSWCSSTTTRCPRSSTPRRPRTTTLLFEDAGTNVAIDLGAMIGFANATDLFDGCEVVVRQRIVNQRVAPCPLEVRAVAARWDGDGASRLGIDAGRRHRSRRAGEAPRSRGERRPRDRARRRRRLRRQDAVYPEELLVAVGRRAASGGRCAGSRPAARTWSAWATAGARCSTSSSAAPRRQDRGLPAAWCCRTPAPTR